jgi:hypothetical protein
MLECFINIDINYINKKTATLDLLGMESAEGLDRAIDDSYLEKRFIEVICPTEYGGTWR